jgi:hypothetical protein
MINVTGYPVTNPEVAHKKLVTWSDVLEELAIEGSIAIQREDPLKVAESRLLLLILHYDFKIILR